MPLRVLTFGVAGTLMVAAMVLVELRRRQPMLKLRLLANRMFRNANIVSAFSIGGFIGLIFVLPQYLQSLRGLSALQSGLATFPQAIGVGIASPRRPALQTGRSAGGSSSPGSSSRR